MKFQVGDKVKVVKICDNDAKRKQYIGKTFVIRAINPNGFNFTNNKGRHYSIGETYIVYENELKLIQRPICTKSDLKDGMVVECRNGERYLVINDKFICNQCWISISSQVADDLSGSCDEYTIDKIYQTTGHNFETLFDDYYLTLIWERPKEEPTKKMTVEEIEKELGYKVEIVSDNNNQ